MQNFLHGSHRQRVSVYECTEHWALGCANLQSDTLFEFGLYAPRQCKWQLRQSSHSLRAGPHSFISGQCSQGILGKPRDGSGKGGGTESERERHAAGQHPQHLHSASVSPLREQTSVSFHSSTTISWLLYLSILNSLYIFLSCFLMYIMYLIYLCIYVASL